MNKQKIAKYFGFKLVRFIILIIAVIIYIFLPKKEKPFLYYDENEFE